MLLTCPEAGFEAAARDAAEALSECGAGYEVGASWGAAAIPAEAETPAAALQLADVRMYAQKERHRGGEGVVLPVDDPADIRNRETV